MKIKSLLIILLLCLNYTGCTVVGLGLAIVEPQGIGGMHVKYDLVTTHDNAVDIVKNLPYEFEYFRENRKPFDIAGASFKDASSLISIRILFFDPVILMIKDPLYKGERKSRTELEKLEDPTGVGEQIIRSELVLIEDEIETLLKEMDIQFSKTRSIYKNPSAFSKW